MPGRLRQPTAASPAQAAQSAVSHYNIPALDFNDTLTWKAGKAIPVADLLTRLSRLGALLRQYDEDPVNQQAFQGLATDLSNAQILGHKDKGVRAMSMVCIADLLRICAPNAPFKTREIKVRNMQLIAEGRTDMRRTYLLSSYLLSSQLSQTLAMHTISSISTSFPRSPSSKVYVSSQMWIMRTVSSYRYFQHASISYRPKDLATCRWERQWNSVSILFWRSWWTRWHHCRKKSQT